MKKESFLKREGKGFLHPWRRGLSSWFLSFEVGRVRGGRVGRGSRPIEGVFGFESRSLHPRFGLGSLIGPSGHREVEGEGIDRGSRDGRRQRARGSRSGARRGIVFVVVIAVLVFQFVFNKGTQEKDRRWYAMEWVDGSTARVQMREEAREEKGAKEERDSFSLLPFRVCRSFYERYAAKDVP